MLDEDMKRVIQKAIRLEELGRKENPENYLGFEWSDIDEPAQTLMKAYRRGILKIGFKSNKHTCYQLRDPEEAKVLLQDGIPENEAIRAPSKITIPADLFDTIIGYDDLKWLIRTSLTADQPVHFLFIGGPATAKTAFLLELARIRGTQYHLGGSSTKVGLTDVLLDLAPRILLIDEFDKMNQDDFSILLSLCVTGLVKETKHGRRRQIELPRTQVFAAANKAVFPGEIPSRFSVLHFPEYTEEEAYKVMIGVLTKRENVPEDLAVYIAKNVVQNLRSKDPRDAVRIGRLASTKEDVDRVILILKKYQGAQEPRVLT
ncbi:MAG: hypothetical protein ACE5NN_03325 [Candidatus Bathyarchaeia archaeon]